MKKALFIDRDGTLVIEPPDTYQINSLEQLEFYPYVFKNMNLIASQLDFELVMVSNQDGMGSEHYPEETFRTVQHKIIQAFGNEGVNFQDVLIDSSWPEDHSPNRKPGTGLLKAYMQGDYDMNNSYVIGDRITDIKLAKNLGCKGILLTSQNKWDELKENGLLEYCSLLTDKWDDICAHLFHTERSGTAERVTKETRIRAEVLLDGNGKADIQTGIGFFDHMLEQIARHSGCNITLEATGDLHVDKHHTIEDTAITLGEAFNQALQDKRGIERYGYVVPMDDALAQVAIDFGGRSWLEWRAEFKREQIGEMPSEMFYHFFKSFADGANCNLNIRAEGANEHHKIEAIFKSLGRAIRMAIHRNIYKQELPTTKGSL